MSKKVIIILTALLCFSSTSFYEPFINNKWKVYADEQKVTEENFKETTNYDEIEEIIRKQEENPTDIQLDELRLSRDADIDFQEDKYKYIVHLSGDCEDVVIKAKPKYKSDSVFINGVQVLREDSYRVVLDLEYGKNIVKIQVNDSESSLVTEYYIYIYRGDSQFITLNNILMDDVQIGFEPQKRIYNLELDEDEDSIRLQMFPKDSHYEIRVNDTLLNGTNAIKLKFNGINKYSIRVAVKDTDSGLESMYNINIYLGIPVTPEVQSAINEVLKPNQWIIANGRWRYNDSQGEYITNTWIYDDQYRACFYFNNRGYMVTGWYTMENGDKYYFNNHGARQSGWIKESSCWYYLDANGIMQTGWVYDKGAWYYLDSDGIMQTGWIYDRGNWYYLNVDGSMKTGWIIYKNDYYYLTDNGNAYMGWLEYNNNWYYMKKGTGEMVKGQWINHDGAWYYINYDGTMRTGWLYKNEKYYYLNEDGTMNKWNKTIDGYYYRFNSDGSADI